MGFAVDRDRLPQPEWLPTKGVVVDGREPGRGVPPLIDAYPTDTG
jgi:hypothetical protein